MFATDFVFNGQRASDYNLVICSFDGEYQPATGGEVEFDVVKPPENDRYTFYGAQYDSVLEWNFSIIKNPCKKTYHDNFYFTNDEERAIYKWLQCRDGYHWFNFCKEYEDAEVLYNVKINIAPHFIGGKTAGFDLTVTADSAFGYTPLQKKKAIINKSKPLILYIDTDTNNYLLPETYITGSGVFYISNDNDPVRNNSNGKASSFTNVSGTIFMDSENMILDGLSLDNFNGEFLRLVDGKNVISTNSSSNIVIEIYYREIRRIAV